MRTKKDIQFLLENGLSSSFLSKLNDSQTKSLVERFNKKETKEAVQTTQQSGYKTTITPGTQANLNINGTDISVDPSKGITMVSTNKPVGTGEVTEVDVNEKFESQSQQNFFWAKCNRQILTFNIINNRFIKWFIIYKSNRRPFFKYF